MNEASTARGTLVEAEERCREEQLIDMEGHNLVIPEDGYAWKKYGQKFIKNIGKNRSYFKCQKTNCRAKKRAEWSSSDPSNLRVVYEGMHTHPSSTHQPNSSQQQASISSANQYNLLTQVFGPDNPS
ncbi:hypothetical protein HHK36_017527 [Tetracentron sinense]|uniref:WRKY domain-containing protein n=1 Tax=Tetracentron sinense TaxID=13715 RepID=A0A835DCX3_TETSI|nr:hypothetical protein HHK36_017527 [Tetracentron sinense]